MPDERGGASRVFGEGDHIGVLVRDRLPGYDNSFKGKQQYCQMHFCSDAQMPRSVKTAPAVLTDRVLDLHPDKWYS